MKAPLTVGIIDLLGKEPPGNGYSRFMRANNTSIMAQVAGVWCEKAGHDVHIAYYSGAERLAGGLPDDIDVLIVNAFSQNALLAYAFSYYYRDKGAVTVLGGPHARSYPEDACRHFDYVVGFCHRSTLADILDEAAPHRPLGRYVSADRQPDALPGLRERWKFLEPSMMQARILRAVPFIGSMGCPYTCSFCIDADVAYQPLDYDVLRDDLRFFLELKLPRSLGVWHDPNFGIRFDDYMGVIEDVVPPGRITFAGEPSLSLLKEDNARRMARNGFKAIAPGVESWFEVGDKSRMRSIRGLEKVRRVADHVNAIQQHIPYVQTNLIFGLDGDEGPVPFELTRRFLDLAPVAFPHFSVLCSFGRNAKLNLDYQREGRVLPVPFHFLDLVQAMNVKPKHYSWTEFYDHVCETFAHAFSARSMARRFAANRHFGSRIEQFFRGISSERNNRMAYHRKMRRWLDEPAFRAFFEGETAEIPPRFVEVIRRHLGPMWDWLPEGALNHNPNAYLESELTTALPVMGDAA